MKKFLKSIAKPFIWFYKKVLTPVGHVLAVPFKGINKLFQKLPNKKKQAIQGYLYILPWIVGFLIFGAVQLGNSIRMSLAERAYYVADEAKGISVFIMKGFSFTQYIQIFRDNPNDVTTILNTFKDVLIVVPLVIVFSLILALLLKKPIKGRGIFRTIFFIPVILLSGNLLGYFSQYGLLVMPQATSEKIVSAIAFYFPENIANIISFAFSKIILILWLSGVQTIIFLSGLNKIDKTVYESAAIEGANGWDSFWKITLPSISGMIIINIIYTTVIYCNLSNNALVSLINKAMLDAAYGRDYAAALSWILFFIEILIIGIYSLIVKLIFKRGRR